MYELAGLLTAEITAWAALLVVIAMGLLELRIVDSTAGGFKLRDLLLR